MTSRGRSAENTVGSRLETRIRERSELLQRTTTLLERDSRISAAWLTGSLAREDHDALSDVDLWIVVSDDAIKDIVASRQQYAARLATPTLILENMTNAPQSGAYLLVHYPGTAGPHHFDWFWQTRSLARFPSNGKLLFDRVNLTVVDGSEWQKEMHQTGNRPPIDETDTPSILTQKNAFFWAMSLIVAKYIARRDPEMIERMMNLVARTLSETTRLLDVSADNIASNVALEIASLTPTDQLGVLRRLAQISTNLQPELSNHSRPLSTGAIDQIETFFELVGDVAAQA